jgi:hypothetical protein
MACIALYEAVFGSGGEVYFVAGDRMQVSMAFGEIRKIAEADPELRGLRSEAARHEASHAAVGIVRQTIGAGSP